MTISCNQCGKLLGETIIINNTEYKEVTIEHLVFCTNYCHKLFSSKPRVVNAYIMSPPNVEDRIDVLEKSHIAYKEIIVEKLKYLHGLILAGCYCKDSKNCKDCMCKCHIYDGNDNCSCSCYCDAQPDDDCVCPCTC